MRRNEIARLEKRNLTLRDILAQARKDTASLDLSKRVLTEIKSIPFFTAENITITFKSNKTTHKSEGIIKFDLSVTKSYSGNRNKNSKRITTDCSFVIALGTVQNGFLLSHTSAMVVTNGQNEPAKRSIQMTFDWDLANSCGGQDAGYVILRVLNTDTRGMDIEYQVPLK